jgi:hypothetical protein
MIVLSIAAGILAVVLLATAWLFHRAGRALREYDRYMDTE